MKKRKVVVLSILLRTAAFYFFRKYVLTTIVVNDRINTSGMTNKVVKMTRIQVKTETRKEKQICRWKTG